MRLTAGAWLLVAASVVVVPPARAADGRGHGGHASHLTGRPSQHFRHRGTVVIFATPFVGVPGVYALPPYYPEPVAIPTSTYGPSPVGFPSPPVAYAAPPPAPAAPPPPAMPQVVEFSSGRYELRGDGLTSPYVWVWIPNPPSAPPPGAAAPRSSASAVYRWTDERGVTTWTDDLQKVPARFRAQAQQPQP